MARGKAYPDETKAAVVAALLAGQSVGAVARQYHIGKTTVLGWRQTTGLDRGSTPVGPQKRAEIDDLLFGYIRKSLVALSVQQDLFAHRPWLEKQPASELAVLHGVSADKVVRILEALQQGDEPEPEREGSDVPL